MFQQAMNSHQGCWEAFKSNPPEYTGFGSSIRDLCYLSAVNCCCVCNTIGKMMQFIQKMCKSWKIPMPC